MKNQLLQNQNVVQLKKHTPLNTLLLGFFSSKRFWAQSEAVLFLAQVEEVMNIITDEYVSMGGFQVFTLKRVTYVATGIVSSAY